MEINPNKWSIIISRIGKRYILNKYVREIMREKVLDWLHRSNYLDELIDYIRLPSRSKNGEEVEICGLRSQEMLRSCGLEVQTFDTKGNKIIFGQSLTSENDPSILIYGHYDVQPEGDVSLWDSEPFEAVVRGDKLYGRGTADNKGQHFAHIMALRYLREFHPQVFEKMNIKFILDGDEELGSFSLPEIVESKKDLLACDFIYISDGPSLTIDAPTIVGSVRGIIDFQIIIKHNSSDLHSGNFGGVARSATIDLINLLGTMVDVNGKVLIDGFYDDVEAPTKRELDALADLRGTYNGIINEYGITRAPLHSNRTNEELNQLYPTLNINGINAGGVGDARRTIIPSEAIASIDCRLVHKQEPEKIKQLIVKHVSKFALEYHLDDAIVVDFGHAMDPVESSINSEYIDLVTEATTEGFGVPPKIVPRLGGSLPIYLFPKFLKSPVILVPLSHPDSRNHAPNENIDIPYMESGIVTTVSLLLRMSRTR